MNIFITIVGIIMVAFIALYVLFPRSLFSFFRNALRRRGKLTLKSIKAGDMVWPYLEGGSPDAEPLVLLHGFGGDKDNWAAYAPEIVGKYRLIAPDLPGFGENTRDIDRDYDMATQASRVRDFLDAMGIEKCHIGGNSMGGFVSLRFALDYPERLISMTLFNNAGVVGVNESKLQKEAQDGKNPLEIHSPDDVKRMLAFVAHKPMKVPGQIRKIFYEDFAVHRALLDKIFWTLVEDGTAKPLNDQLDQVKAPTLIIWGRHDQLIDVSCVDVLEKGIPNAESIIFEDVGHIPMIENPKGTAKRHLEFLAKH
ncbi:alpha/beta fold hydrolase [uncultured Parasphingorhabdus sp.]|uniref:alpha/beta fold hydrolase n=1 Tax=uncultured Parasphingorhabdus sp. TaxID=2709694 RepID=UPI0030DCF045|tara:strand:- start:43095 stop:44024 length:930 start_codon:yes stop_codon:yes gene_type:complete